MNSTDAYANSIRINGSPKGQNGNAWQVVQLNQPGSQTYVLSGWAKANAVPDNVQENSDQALDQNKQFGLPCADYLCRRGNGGALCAL